MPTRAASRCARHSTLFFEIAMPPGLPTHIHVARPGPAVIVLDLRRNLYQRLGPAASDALTALANDPAAPLARDIREALDAAGLLSPSSPRRVRFPSATPLLASALECTGPGDGETGRARVAAALLAARLRLRTRGLARTLGWARRPGRATPVPPERGAALARTFERARTDLPFARQCLPDSLALHGLLRAQGIAARLVIGVRDPPFAAHAWVESGDWVLSDTLAAVAEFTPIWRS